MTEAKNFENAPSFQEISKSLVSLLHGRKFVTTGNEHGLATTATSFQYFVDGTTVSGEYRGGEIILGRIVGKAIGPTTIELLFQCVTADGKLMCGMSSGRVGQSSAGLLTLDFEWSWLTGERTSGTSSYIEVREP
ncbi:hypothetical protein [Bradyrhizobium sp. USDA 10063]